MDENRCSVCGWPMSDSAERGCVPGNCSMRPRPRPTYEEQVRTGERRSLQQFEDYSRRVNDDIGYLKDQLAASERKERMLRDACKVARVYLDRAPVADRHWYTGVVQALDAALADERTQEQ